MVWSVFNYLLIQKLPRKANVALGFSQYKKLLKTLKVAHKLPSTIYLCLSLSPVPSVHSRDRKGLWEPKVDVITRSSGVKNNSVWQTEQEAGHRTYHVNENERIYGQADYPT